MNRFTVLTGFLALALALWAGTLRRYHGAPDLLDDDGALSIFEMPYPRLLLGVVAVIAGILTAADVYLIVTDVTRSPVSGGFVAVAAWIVISPLSGWCAERLHSLKYRIPASFQSSR